MAHRMKQTLSLLTFSSMPKGGEMPVALERWQTALGATPSVLL